jgi:hypothetical protein
MERSALHINLFIRVLKGVFPNTGLTLFFLIASNTDEVLNSSISSMLYADPISSDK